jgi:hypothetical protein
MVQVVVIATRRKIMPRKLTSRINDLQQSLEAKQQQIAAIAERIRKTKLKDLLSKNNSYNTLCDKIGELSLQRWKLRANLAKKHLSIKFKEQTVVELKKLVAQLEKDDVAMTEEYEAMIRKRDTIEKEASEKLDKE